MFPTAGLGFARVGSSFAGLIGFFPGWSSIAIYRVVRGGPNPEKRPDRMKGEETDPPGRVNGILVGMIPLHGHVIRDDVNRDHSVGEGQDHKDKDGEREIAEKVHGGRGEFFLFVKELQQNICAVEAMFG